MYKITPVILRGGSGMRLWPVSRAGFPKQGENQFTYIPLGEVCHLAKPGKVPLEIIEVQSGSYLGEDDAVEFEDSYRRP